MVDIASTVIRGAALGLQLIKFGGDRIEANRQRKRNVADQKLICQELNDIKYKIQAQSKRLSPWSRASLLSSVEFLKGGVFYLYHFFEQQESRADDDSHEESEAEVASAASKRFELSSGRMEKLLCRLGDVQLDKLSPEALHNLKECKKRFEKSREKATEAFSDESSLSPSDRVLALKIRIIATILENVDTMSVAVAEECKLFVEELNSLPQVSETFKKIGALGNVKNWILKVGQKRRELVSNVAEVNFFVWKYECMCRGSTVPVHDLDTFAKLPHPISYSREYCKDLDLGNKKRPVEERVICAIDMAVSSEGNMVICDVESGKVKVFSRDGDFMFSFGAPPDHEVDEMSFKPFRIAIDRTSEKMYVVYSKDYSKDKEFHIAVFNKSGEYLQTINTGDELFIGELIVSIAVDSTGNLLVLSKERDSMFIYVIEHDGELIYKSFRVPDVFLSMTICDMTITDNGRVVVTDSVKNVTFVFTEDGRLINEIKVNCYIGPVVYSPHTNQIVVHTITRDGIDKLKVYTCDGSHVHSFEIITELQSGFGCICCLAATPEGSVAVLTVRGILTYMLV